MRMRRNCAVPKWCRSKQVRMKKGGVMGNHTAGPWTTYQDQYCIAVKDATGHVICQMGDCDGRLYDVPEVADENARLIAAAPDMLAALEAIAGRMRYHLDCGGVVEANEILIACDVAIRAIEKARGE